MIKTGQVFTPFYKGTNKITLEGYNHLTWRYKIIPYIRTDGCTDMSNMFSGADYSLPETLDLRNFNTSHVTTMRSMFENNMSTSILGFDIFDTSNVEDMNAMFKGSKATTLDLSNFNTSKVVDMGSMFCDSDVTDLDISSFDTSLVVNMSSLFENVSASIDVSNFDTSNLVNAHNMFKGTSGTTLDLTHFDMSNVTDMSGMFSNTDYEDIDYSAFDTSSAITMESMFDGTTIETIDVSDFNMSNVTSIRRMFAATKPQTFVFPNTLDTSNVENISGLFSGAEIDVIDLTGMSLSNVTDKRGIFSGLKSNLLDISDWDLGEHSIIGSDYTDNEMLFSSANIHEIRFSNSNNFPEGYSVASMFYNFETDGVLDLSSFNFYKVRMNSSSGMFQGAKINTLILPNFTDDSFDTISSYSQIYKLFGEDGASVELLDGSNTVINSNYGGDIFNKLVATRINMPNWIVGEQPYTNTSYRGSAKYVDYSALDTKNVNYTSNQWEVLSQYVNRYTKITWIPSTFVLDGNRSMYNLVGDVYTDALNYNELGWDSEPINAIMHYGTSHAEFEQAILNDDPDDWVSPSGCELFFCHTHVPLGSILSQYQFDPRLGDIANSYYYDIYLDDAPLEYGYVFDEVGTHILRLVDNRTKYEYKQTITVVDHGNTYSIVGNPMDYLWDSTNKRYVSSVSTKVQCRLYPDNYLFIYPLDTVLNSAAAYTAIESAPSTNIVKISGVPFNLQRLYLNNCRQLSDISELIVITYGEHGFMPSSMFLGCSSLVDASSLEKWQIKTYYEYMYVRNNRSYTGHEYYTYSSIFSGCTSLASAPRVSFSGGSLFYGCANLTDISKLKVFATDGNISNHTVNLGSLFYGCSRLSNVNRLKDIFKYYKIKRSETSLNLYSAFYQTRITNTDFIPDEGLRVASLDNAFSACTLLTNLNGLGRIIWDQSASCTFNNAFNGIPATDYSPLANWSYPFTGINMYNTKITNLSFLSDWDLSKCSSYSFGACTSLTSISALSGKISTTLELTMQLSDCTALTSLVGLSGCKFGTSSTTNFRGCTSLTSLNGLQGCTFSYVGQMFYRCTSLSDISALGEVTFTSSVNNINGMFEGCTSLQSLNGLQSIDVSNMTSLSSVFSGCTALTNITAISAWNPYQVTNVAYLFYNCSSITSFAALQNWTTGILTNVNQAFRGCSSLINLGGLMGFNVGQCTSLSYLFAGCTALADISDITLWYIGACTNLSYMFQNCTSLTSVNPLKGWYVAKLTDMRYMFFGCTAIADASILEQWKNVKTMTSVSRTYAFRNVPTPWPTWAVS